MERIYSLKVIKRPEAYGLELVEETTKRRVERIWGNQMMSIMDHILEAIKKSGYAPSSLTKRRRKPFNLKEEEAVRIGLLFKAVKPLRKYNRIEKISSAVKRMEREEVYYWFSKCTSETDSKRNCKAFRIMEAAE
ncbi:MAG: hypothetical protein K8S62_11855 [Candidatus Sabulitectum sp.]|nr:hypothetical protein [Candidatus Sabulitectum sp.]